jgi:hypothetical protein
VSGTVRRQVDLLISGALSPQSIAALFATEARRQRDDAISRGDAPPAFDTYTDGVKGQREEAVKLGGSVVYAFNLLPPAVSYAYSFAIARSPVKSGRYRQNWIVAVNGQNYTGDLEHIPSDATVLLVNIVPYARKLDVGHGRKVTIASHLTEDTRQATRRRFPNIDCERIFVNLPPSLSRAGIPVPWPSKKGAITYPAVEFKVSAR